MQVRRFTVSGAHRCSHKLKIQKHLYINTTHWISVGQHNTVAIYKEKGEWCGVVVVLVVGWGVVYRRTQTIIYSIKLLYQFYNPKTRKDLTHLGENDEGVPDLDEAA